MKKIPRSPGQNIKGGMSRQKRTSPFDSESVGASGGGSDMFLNSILFSLFLSGVIVWDMKCHIVTLKIRLLTYNIA